MNLVNIIQQFGFGAQTTRVYDLAPVDGRQSFYGKAKIIVENGREALQSYSTVVAYRDAAGQLHRTWSGWSATTGRHLYAFAGIRKRDWDKMPVESL